MTNSTNIYNKNRQRLELYSYIAGHDVYNIKY